jgi:hypothetical protein
MADILEFRVKPKRGVTASKRRKRRNAEIVIFPGVRYERWMEAESPSAEVVAPQRDTLRLVE